MREITNTDRCSMRVHVGFLSLLILLALCGFGTSSASAAEDKSVNGFFGLYYTSGLAGELRTPGGIAVSQSNGRIYVADSDGNNSRISVFDSSGAFLRTWGKDVVISGPGDIGTDFEICVPADGDICKRGVNFAPQVGGVMGAPRGAALDSAGDVYVLDQSNRRIQKFDEDGNFILAFGQDVIASGQPGDSGAGFEVCTVASECKQGVSAASGGAFANTFQGHLTIAPSGAPNEGNLLVADPGNRRVQEFTSAGAFVRAFGWDVVASGQPNDIGTEFEVCEIASECQAGAAGAGTGQFVASAPTRITEDAAGNIYTVEPTPSFRVQRFSLPGNVVAPQGPFAPGVLTGTSTAAPTDVAIDAATNNVLVTKMFPAGSTGSCPLTGEPSTAERRVLEVSAGETLEATHGVCAGIVANGSAVRGSTGEVYASTNEGASNGRVYVLNTPLAPPTAGISGVFEIDAHGAAVSGFVNPQGPEDLAYGPSTTYRIEFKRSTDSEFSQTAAFDAGKGTTNVLVSKRLGNLEAGTSYDVRFRATKPFVGTVITGTFSFSTPTAPPEVGVPSATAAATPEGDVRAALWGQVTPNSQETSYRFEYGMTASYGTKVPALDESVGSGASTVPVAQYLEGLEPETTYHFRIVAKNATGADISPDQTFTTPPLGSELPDNRAPELVTPADKGSSGSVALDVSGQQQFQASPDGNSFLYPLTNGLDSSTAGGWLRQLASRTTGGWLSTQLSPSSLIPPPGGHEENRKEPSRLRFSAPDNSCGFVETFNPITSDTLSASVELGVTNLYRWNADGSYELITDRLPLNPDFATSSFYYPKVDASDDCDRVFFQTNYELLPGASGLYEWDEGILRDAGVLPNGEGGASLGLVGRAVLGGEVDGGGTARWNAVSPDGQRLFFTAKANEGPSVGTPAVFMRENGGSEVTEISASQTTVPTTGARFETASGDAGVAIFRANYGIASTSSAGRTDQSCGPIEGETDLSAVPKLEKKPCDLYAYDVDTDVLTDLSADTNAVDPIGAAIQGAVAIDDDGSHVYFAAMGQLVPGKGRTHAQNAAGNGSANVYLAHDGQLDYVTTLAEHGDTSAGNQTGDLLGPGHGGDGRGAALMRRATIKWVANTTPDGGKLLFVSSLPLTGWDSGGIDKYAAYLYSADPGNLVCLSCRLDGQESIALPHKGGQFAQSTWLLAGPNAAYRPRSFSDDGARVFFTSPDVLAPGAVAGSRNVYQWQDDQVRLLVVGDPGGVNGVREYLDSTPSGDSVFVGTKEQLAPQDTDFLSDVYDLRVNGGFPFTPEPPECQVDDTVPLVPNQIYCQPVSSPQPDQANPSSSSFAGKGNVKGVNPCAKRARRAQALSRRAKVLRGQVKRAGSRKAARRNANRARRAAKAARRNSQAAKRCRRRARAANFDRGGVR